MSPVCDRPLTVFTCTSWRKFWIYLDSLLEVPRLGHFTIELQVDLGSYIINNNPEIDVQTSENCIA